MDLDLKSVSSSVKKLIPLIIYLKFILVKGDTLIIEEPENHLHPKHQLILAKYFVKLINNGLKIILTTHSDYIVEQLNNFIRLGNMKKDMFNELNYTSDCILNPETINIYHFKQKNDYSVVPELIDINFTGFVDENFNEVIDDLYDEIEFIIDNKI